jgi:uncharacterized protein with GYD domain
MEVFYWMFGEWDGLVIYEVGDASMASTLSAVATASGLIERVKPTSCWGRMMCTPHSIGPTG